MKKGEYSEKTIRLRKRVQEILDHFGTGLEFKKADLCTDIELREVYTTPGVINNMLTRELDRLMELGEVSHTGKYGVYKIERRGKE